MGSNLLMSDQGIGSLLDGKDATDVVMLDLGVLLPTGCFELRSVDVWPCGQDLCPIRPMDPNDVDRYRTQWVFSSS
jgi:hypothetical protein